MKKIISVCATITLIISMVGCKKTPDSSIVIGKDYENMMEQAMLGEQTDDPIAVRVGAQEKYILAEPLINAVGNLEVFV